ncbi:MAG TPA: hypothetical protein VFU47_16780, partial [Armatimonadota bacterium]|nr:hypothetical protein [Armatimonadota bacterium]
MPTELPQTWDEAARFFSEAMREEGEWAGVPVPLPGLALVIEDRYPYKGLEKIRIDDSGAVEQSETESGGLEPGEELVNHWVSHRHRREVFVLRKDGRSIVVSAPYLPERERLRYFINTSRVAVCWSVRAEAKATEKLSQLVSEHAVRNYLLTGAFVETSRRSGVSYLFRRLRPTLAFRLRQ